MQRSGRPHLAVAWCGAVRAAALGVLVAMMAACSPGSDQPGPAPSGNATGDSAGASAGDLSGESPARPPSATGPGAAAGAGAGSVHPGSGVPPAPDRSVATPPPLKVGETAQVRPLAITLLKVAIQPAPDGEQKHWALKMAVENRGGERYRFLSAVWLRLEAPDGRRYRPSRTVSQWAGDPLDGELAPGGMREGWVGFAAPLTPGEWTLLVGPEGPAEAAFRLSVPEKEPPPAEPEPPVWRTAERGSPPRRRITNRIWT